MLAQTSLSILMLLARVALSTEEKPEDCIKHKQYWSTSFIDPSGACVACPPNYKSCRNEPYEDQKRCEDSCRVKEPTKKPSSINVTPPSPPTSDIRKATPSPSIRNAVFLPVPTEVEPNKNRDEPSSNKGSDGSGHWQIWISILSCIAVVCLVIIALLVLWRRKQFLQKRREVGGNDGDGLPLNKRPWLPQPNGNGDEEQHLRRQNGEEPVEGYSQRANGLMEEHVARQETQPPVQSATSNIVGIQEDHFQSSLNVQPEYEN